MPFGFPARPRSGHILSSQRHAFDSGPPVAMGQSLRLLSICGREEGDRKIAVKAGEGGLWIVRYGAKASSMKA